MTPSSLAASPSAIRLQGPCNFRDLGGQPTPHGMVRRDLVFRSDGLHTMNHADLAVIRDQLGITSIIDLRSHDEDSDDGLGLVFGSGIRRHHIPILVEVDAIWTDPTFRLMDLYRHIATDCAPELIAAIRLLAAVDEPVVFHCTAGKDRTGVLAAVVLALIGVEDDDICLDYARTGPAIPLLRARFDERVGDPRFSDRLDRLGDQERIDATINELLSARAATMEEFLFLLRREHGSIEGWACHHDLDGADAGRLRARLVG